MKISLLARRFWWVLPILGLAAALLFTRATLAGVKRDRDAAVMKLAVTAASLDRLSAELERVTAEQRALSAADRRRIAASRDTLNIADAAARARQAMIARLTASAAKGSAPDCRASDTVREVWK